jgi:hypothetical protein
MKTVTVTEDMALHAGVELTEMIKQYERQGYYVAHTFNHPAVGMVYVMNIVDIFHR